MREEMDVTSIRFLFFMCPTFHYVVKLLIFRKRESVSKTITYQMIYMSTPFFTFSVILPQCK